MAAVLPISTGGAYARFDNEEKLRARQSRHSGAKFALGAFAAVALVVGAVALGSHLAAEQADASHEPFAAASAGGSTSSLANIGAGATVGKITVNGSVAYSDGELTAMMEAALGTAVLDITGTLSKSGASARSSSGRPRRPPPQTARF